MSEKQNNRQGSGRFTEHLVPNVYCSECWHKNRNLVGIIFCSIATGGGNTHISTGYLRCPECNRNLGMFSGDRYRLCLLNALYKIESTFI